MTWIFTRSIDSTPMRLTTMYCVIATILKQLNERLCNCGTWHSSNLGNTITIPLGQSNRITLVVSSFVTLQSPISNTMTRHIHTRHKTTTCWRTYRTCVSLCKHNTLLSQSFHIRSLIHFIVLGLLIPKRQRSVLPPHIVNNKHDNIWAVILLCI